MIVMVKKNKEIQAVTFESVLDKRQIFGGNPGRDLDFNCSLLRLSYALLQLEYFGISHLRLSSRNLFYTWVIRKVMRLFCKKCITFESKFFN